MARFVGVLPYGRAILLIRLMAHGKPVTRPRKMSTFFRQIGAAQRLNLSVETTKSSVKASFLANKEAYLATIRIAIKHKHFSIFFITT